VRWQKQVFIHKWLSRAYLALAKHSCLMFINWDHELDLSGLGYVTSSVSIDRLSSAIVDIVRAYTLFRLLSAS